MRSFPPCSEWAERLVLRSADLSPQDLAARTAHVRTCLSCQAAQQDYDLLELRIRALPPPAFKPLPRLIPSLLEHQETQEEQEDEHTDSSASGNAIIHRFPGKRPSFAPLLSGLLVASIIGAVLVSSLLLLRSQQTTLVAGTLPCASGSIAMSGSSALYPLAQAVARSYQDKCAGASIFVNQSSSSSGLYDVETGTIQIGNSDIVAPARYKNLVDHPVAAVIFAVALNPALRTITNLSRQELQGIYQGSIHNWKELGGPDLPIRLFSRPSTSGTRVTFEQAVLGKPESLPLGPTHVEVDRTDMVADAVQKTPGAIGYLDVTVAMQYGLKVVSLDHHAPSPSLVRSNVYTFWSIEHMYTRGVPAPKSLTDAFIHYMGGNSAQEIATSLGYVSYQQMQGKAVVTHSYSVADA